MKFTIASILLGLVVCVVESALPDCQVNDVEGYGNCKHDYFVNAPGSDVLWCIAETDCNKVFYPPTGAPTAPPTEAPVSVSAVEEMVTSGGGGLITHSTVGTALFAATAAAAFL